MDSHAVQPLALGSFTLDAAGLVVTGEPTFGEWEQVGQFLQRAEASVLWWVGDWLNFGERHWGEKYTQALDTTGLDYSTLRNAKWVASEFELSRRRDKLTFSHHREVSGLPAREADRLLSEAEHGGLTTRELRSLVRDYKKAQALTAPGLEHGCTADDLHALADSGKRFGCIYADPPWRYGNQGTRAATDNHYGTMAVEEIAELPVGRLAAERSHLWLWTTNGFLKEALGLIDHWGFEFKSSYIWVKPQMGIGNYLRNAHEFLLLGVRGGLVGQASDVMSWGQYDRTKHSEKPEEIRQGVVMKVSPPPYLELFGRRLAAGWVVWGDQIERDIFAELAEAV